MSATDSSPPLAGNPPGAACVYYDGGCPLCRAEIATYQRTPGGETLRWVDAQACSPAELGHDLPRQAALARLHVRRADGTLVQGAAAFAEIWASLPRWAWLARLARWPLVVPVLDLGYAAFLRLRRLWRPAPAPHGAAGTGGALASPRAPLALAAAASAPVIEHLPLALRRELRTDHAGETGAVMIYRGILAVSRDASVRAFATHHLATEQRHLQAIEAVVPPAWQSRLLPLWRISGWLTGALPALAGPRAVFATIQAVETFVDGHYADQVQALDAIRRAPGQATPAGPDAALLALRTLLEDCRQDEVAHRDDAACRWDARPGLLLRAWQSLVGRGSAVAVSLCRRV